MTPCLPQEEAKNGQKGASRCSKMICLSSFPIIKQYMNNKVIIISLLLLFSSCSNDIPSCGCENEGQCLQSQDLNNYCKCPANFIDRFCNIQTQELTEKNFTAEVTPQYSYYHITFNNTILYLIQMYFCPIDDSQTSNFEIYLEFEQKDGAIDHNSTHKKVMKFEAGKNLCLEFKMVLSATQNKYDSTPPRLVIRLRQRQSDSEAQANYAKKLPANSTNETKSSKMSIIIYKFEIYELQSLQIGQFFAISLFSALLILLFSYFLCRRTLMRRYRRYHFHPAQLIQNISHFDTLMPTVLQQCHLALPEDAKECMICLLTVEDTYTRTTPCRHLFHKQCIDQWGRKSLTCPACRSSLAPAGHETLADLE